MNINKPRFWLVTGTTERTIDIAARLPDAYKEFVRAPTKEELERDRRHPDHGKKKK